MKPIGLFFAFYFAYGLCFGQSPLKRPSSGQIQRLANFPSRFITPRNVDVWLPDGYSDSKKYAVVYMHDGQMLFDTTGSWTRQEWGVDETITRLVAEKKIRDCIVVGIWNVSIDRFADYFPQKAFYLMSEKDRKMILADNSGRWFHKGKPLSDAYLNFLVSELKPFIDSAYSTKKDRANTFISGASRGGLISLYGICEYPAVFGGAACLSTHWPGIYRLENNPMPDAIIRYLAKNLPSPSNHKIYFDYGTKSLDTLYKPVQMRVDTLMRNRGFQPENWITQGFEGDKHDETTWGRRLHIPLLFLLKPNN